MSSILESVDGFLPWQERAYRAALDGQFDVIISSGGFGSGKTALNTHIMRAICARGDQRGIVIGRAKNTLQDTVVKTIEEEIPPFMFSEQSKISPNYRWFLKGLHKDSELLSKTMQYNHEAHSQLKSINADFGWLVEMTTLPLNAYLLLLGRLRRHGSEYNYPILGETNPDSKSHWVYKTFLKSATLSFEGEHHKEYQKKIEYEDENGDTKTIRTIVFDTTTYANPYFPRHVIAQMKDSFSESEFQRMVMGLWVAREGKVWEGYTTFKHPKNPKEYAEKYDRVFIGVDPGQTHPTAVIFIGFAGGTYEIFDEYVATNRSVRGILGEIRKRVETWGLTTQGYYTIWVDPSAKQWTKEFNSIPDRGPFPAYQSRHKGTDPALNRALRLDEMLRIKKLIVSDLCTSVIQDLESTVYDEGSVKEKVDKKEYDPHAMDAVGYAIMKEV